MPLRLWPKSLDQNAGTRIIGVVVVIFIAIAALNVLALFIYLIVIVARALS